MCQIIGRAHIKLGFGASPLMDRWRGWAGENPLKFSDFVTRLGTGQGGGVTGKRSYLGSIFIKSDAKTHAGDVLIEEVDAGDVMSTRALLSAARPRTIRVWLRGSFVKLAFWRGKCG